MEEDRLKHIEKFVLAILSNYGDLIARSGKPDSYFKQTTFSRYQDFIRQAVGNMHGKKLDAF